MEGRRRDRRLCSTTGLVAKRNCFRRIIISYGRNRAILDSDHCPAFPGNARYFFGVDGHRKGNFVLSSLLITAKNSFLRSKPGRADEFRRKAERSPDVTGYSCTDETKLIDQGKDYLHFNERRSERSDRCPIRILQTAKIKQPLDARRVSRGCFILFRDNGINFSTRATGRPTTLK